jgi:hypothetical protein
MSWLYPAVLIALVIIVTGDGIVMRRQQRELARLRKDQEAAQ